MVYSNSSNHTGKMAMDVIPAKALLSLIGSWKEQEVEYQSEGLLSEYGALMMHRVELEELLKAHNAPLSKAIESNVIGAERYGVKSL